MLEGYSPKLGRRVQLFDHARFAVWIGLEAAATVLSFCERPVRVGPRATDMLVDFWLRLAKKETFLVVTTDQPAHAIPAQIDGIEVRVVGAADRAAANVWVSNWQRMLPVLNATRAAIPASLLKSVRRFVHGPTSLAHIEQELSFGDPSIVRGAVFELLRTGQLAAPSLHTEPLYLHTMVEPAP